MDATRQARYALYYAPAANTTLWAFGSKTLGYDAATGAETTPDAVAGLAPDVWHRWTEEPRRYGFHATLKAPFGLADDVEAIDLLDAVRLFAHGKTPLRLPGLAVRQLGGFVALTLGAPDPAVHAFAQVCVEEFDRFRATLNTTDRARRLKSPLTDGQRSYLDRYGYPYVGDDFRFHMTLTGNLSPADAALATAHLADQFAALAKEDWRLDAITVFRQAHRADRFRVLARVPLG